MIQANCRARFTATDFDFIVRTLARSPSDAIPLGDLLVDLDTRDAILDHELLLDAILSQNGTLSISSHLYFYILTRHVLKRSGIIDRKLCDYIASLLEEFSRTKRMQSPVEQLNHGLIYLSDMLLALKDATPEQTFLIRAHVGNYSLFISGIFHENVQRRSEKGAPDFTFYEEMGRMSFKVAASHAAARRADLCDVYGLLAEGFRDVRHALNRLADEMLYLDPDVSAILPQA